MRAFAFASAISLLVAAGAADAAPRRAASLNLCTDELLLMLAASEQIASVTHLAQKEAETPLWRQARRYRTNDGSLVSVAGLRPDLVLTMGGGARDRVRIAERLGIRILDLPYPQTIGDVEKSIGTVAAALGRPDRARPLLNAIEALKRSAPHEATESIWLGGGGRSVGPESLAGQWMALAGLRQRPLPGDRLTLEQLLVAPPRILLRSDYRAGQYSGEQRWLAHPLAKATGKARTLVTDGRLWTCMGPLLGGEIARLKAVRK
ncbi:ABC transporter substrate-binding protein [Sphingosinicella sp. BN140058]|uniref:ABC transporter substrate-binding protein n=1 Tax=Sphingosinicella sp. BN140058 TaxID=1892855 RepID=UPI0013ED0AF9|nr:ABC transporter substrate-binding protein [Sphingosinicella sp. BN140058]